VIVCGLKLTHDGTVALLEDDGLVASIEMEKVGNNPRYQQLDQLERVEELLAACGVRLADVDVFVVDGWYPEPWHPAPWHPAPGEDPTVLWVSNQGRPVAVPVASYQEPAGLDPLQRYRFEGLRIGSATVRYSSYYHATQHLLGAYCTSPFAERGEPALVLVWDGGLVPTLYSVETDPFRVRNLGALFQIYGCSFADFAAEFDPFRPAPGSQPRETHAMPVNLDVAGKAMAYAALGQNIPELYSLFDAEFAESPLTYQTGGQLGRRLNEQRSLLAPGCTEADFIATFQDYIAHKLHTALRQRVPRLDPRGPAPNLCLAGGCALNIKWNSTLRASGLFREIWVPPFPNDSGAALGTAAAELVHHGRVGVQWDVYRGPELGLATEVPGWSSEPCDERGLARLLHERGEPVLILNGRAELGPRALGNRSILAPAGAPKMKDRLNDLKNRERYRPVAPVCLEDRASEIFSPGTPDPYMLFDHRVRAEWVERIPAVIHLDGTARLQTITPRQNPVLARVLAEYDKLSGVPVLCNTSANHKGCGFFPDVRSAADWGRVDAIWSGGRLHRRRS
jgi:carbamoyltransferase